MKVAGTVMSNHHPECQNLTVIEIDILIMSKEAIEIIGIVEKYIETLAVVIIAKMDEITEILIEVIFQEEDMDLEVVAGKKLV